MYERCEICGGVTTCPHNEEVRPVRMDQILTIPAGEPIPAGYVVTHRRLRSVIAVPEWATVVGSNHRRRVAAHHHLRPVWVGQCAYAFTYPDEEQQEQQEV